MHTMTAHERWALTGQWFACNTNEFNLSFVVFKIQLSVALFGFCTLFDSLNFVPLLMTVLYMWVQAFLFKGIIPCA